MEKAKEDKKVEDWEIVEVPVQMTEVYKKGEEILNDRQVILKILNNTEKIILNLAG